MPKGLKVDGMDDFVRLEITKKKEKASEFNSCEL